MNETTAVFIGIIIGVFLVLFCCAILYAYTKISKKIEDFRDTERRAYTKARDRAINRFNEIDDRIKALEESDRERKRSDEKLRREVESLKEKPMRIKTDKPKPRGRNLSFGKDFE